MRRLLLFAAIFGAGLALLLFIARTRDREPVYVPPQTEHPPGRPDEPMVPIPRDRGGEQATQPLGALGGRLETARFDPGDEYPRFHLVAEDTRHLSGDVHDLRGITCEAFDTRTGDLRATLSAERGTAPLRPVAGGAGFEARGPVILHDVVLTVLDGAPFTPFTLRVPVLEVDLEAKVYRSDEPLRVEGSGMDAASRGFEVRHAEGTLRLTREAWVDLWVDDSTRAQLAATGDGPILVTRVGEPDATQGEIRIDVLDGARFILEGREPLRSDSRSLHIEGRAQGGEGARRFVPTEAVARGEAVVRREADVFEGDEAHFDFDAEGMLEGARLVGEPRAKVWVAAALEEREDAGRVRLEIEGEGPLVARFRPRTSFELAGPGRVLARALDLEVSASRTISGWAVRDEGEGHLELDGDVEALFEGSVFRGPSLELDFFRDEDREPVAEGRTPGPSLVSGLDERGREALLETLGEARWRLSRGELEIPFARGALVRVAGEDGFDASAGVLRDFRLQAQTFTGGGGVEYASERGSVRAERVVVHGPERHVFLGAPGAPAVMLFEGEPERGLESGVLRAALIERDGERAVASGDVELELAAADGRHELAAEWLELIAPDPEAEDAPRPFTVSARNVHRAEIAGEFGSGSLAARELELEGHILPDEPEAPEERRPPAAEIARVEARGAVRIDFEDEAQLSGEGERFHWTPEEGGLLEGSPAERARAVGRLSANELPYRMSAERIHFGAKRLEALWPQIVLDETRVAPDARAEDALIGASSEWMSADEHGVLFAGVAHMVGRLASGRDWRLNAGAVHLFFREPGEQPEGPLGALRSLVAWEGFSVSVGAELRASGELLDADFRTLRMEGRPARLDMLGFTLESPYIEYDLEQTLVRTEQGTLSGGAGTELEGWTLGYESLRPFETPDATILVVRNPVFRNAAEGEELRAGWALFWVDRDHWRQKTAEWLGADAGPVLAPRPFEDRPPVPQREIPSLFGRFRPDRISRLLNEVYVEGDVEFLRAGRRIARMGAAYLDLVDGHGWLQDAELEIDIEVRDQPAVLVARADWMRHSADGSLHADSAIATTCTFAEPHFFVRTKDLRFTPSGKKGAAWTVSLRRNSLRFDNGIGVPLPPIGPLAVDRFGRPLFDDFGIGRAARFGSFVTAAVNGSLGAVGDGVARATGVEKEQVDGRIRYRASYLRSRGILLGTGVEASVADRFRLLADIDAIPDDARDRGMVRVPTDERSDLRYLLRARARYMQTGREWYDFAFAHQSDPGVQAEFFEGSFLRYEERDNHVHWRKAEETDYRSITLRYRLDDFRNYVEKLPGVTLYGGARPVGTVLGLPLLYRADTDFAVLRRRIGDGSVLSPFDPTFDDELGDIAVMRIDSEHRVELPVELKLAGWRMAPYTGLRGTFWSDTDGDGEWAGRADLMAGVEASSTYLRQGSGGGMHSLTPTVGLRADVAALQDGADPIPIDHVEDPREGTFVDVGLRGRWWTLRDPSRRLSVDLRSTHAAEVEEGAEDGWVGVAVLGELQTRVAGMPVVMIHDGRYDLDDDRTLYSRSRLGFAPHRSIGLEVGFGTGRDSELVRVFEALHAGARWRASDKWEFEVRETVDLRNNDSLNTRLLLRRYGHDFIFELEITERSGEGSSFGISIKPVLGFRRPSLGMIERWLDDEY